MINQVPENARRETKFVVPETEAQRIFHWLRVHPEGLRMSYPSRWVNSIYFDSFDYSAYRQNLDGASQRTKVRYRWYGAETYPDAGTLEVKCKRNYFGWKLKFPINALECNKHTHWNELLWQFRAGLSAEAMSWLEMNPQPAVLIRYYRHYFETCDGRIRATLDERQRMFDQRYKPFINVANKANICRTAVLELKFHRGERDRAAQLIKTVPARVSRNSKYIMGLRSVHGF